MATLGTENTSADRYLHMPKDLVTNQADISIDEQDEVLWEVEFAASQDTLDRLAAQARAHRTAGRTKKISA